MEVIDVPDEILSTLMSGNNNELLGEDVARFQIRVRPFLFDRGDQDEPEMLMEEGELLDYSPKVQPLKDEYIEKLEDVRVEESGTVCSICLDEMEKGSEVKRLPCCHMYHRNCIGEWLNNSNTCPLCRHQIPES